MPVNATFYAPYDAGAGANVTEDSWRKMARLWKADAVVAGQLNELNPFGDSTGLQAKVNTGAAWVRGQYGEWTSATSTLGLSAVGGIAGGSERWDRLIVRNDFVNNVMQLDVLTGTAGASPNSARPALTQSSSVWEMLLADVGPLVNTTTTVTAAMVVDGRWLAGDDGTPFYRVSPSSGTSIVVPAAGVLPSWAHLVETDWVCRSAVVANTDTLRLRYNADSGANYNYCRSALIGTYSSTGGTNAQTAGEVALVGGNSGTPSSGTIRHLGPAATGMRRQYTALTVRDDATIAASGPEVAAGDWNNTANAITTITYLLVTGPFASGSVFTTRAWA